MKPHLPLLAISLLLLTISHQLSAQTVIEETKDYILKECDSVYYYSHGLPPKDDFVLDTTKIHKVNGVLKLPLDNGKEVVFRDIWNKKIEVNEYLYRGINKSLGYYLVEGIIGEWEENYLINTKNGVIDSIQRKPNFSLSGIYFGYCYYFYVTMEANVRFKNIKKNKTCKITLENEGQAGFKWLNDNSFLFISSNFTLNSKNKYYKVQIK